MAVRAQQGLAGFAETLHVSGVADPVPGAAIPDAEAVAGALEKAVVVRVSEVFLQQVVIDVLCRQLGLHAVELHGLELQHHQRSGRVLRQRLIDSKRDLLARDHVAVDQMGGDQLVGDSACVVIHAYPRECLTSDVPLFPPSRSRDGLDPQPAVQPLWVWVWDQVRRSRRGMRGGWSEKCVTGAELHAR